MYVIQNEYFTIYRTNSFIIFSRIQIAVSVHLLRKFTSAPNVWKLQIYQTNLKKCVNEL